MLYLFHIGRSILRRRVQTRLSWNMTMCAGRMSIKRHGMGKSISGLIRAAETVCFGVEWLSEDEIRMTYDDLDDEYDEKFILAI